MEIKGLIIVCVSNVLALTGPVYQFTAHDNLFRYKENPILITSCVGIRKSTHTQNSLLYDGQIPTDRIESELSRAHTISRVWHSD